MSVKVVKHDCDECGESDQKCAEIFEGIPDGGPIWLCLCCLSLAASKVANEQED